MADRLILRHRTEPREVIEAADGSFFMRTTYEPGHVGYVVLSRFDVASKRGMTGTWEAVDDDWRLL
jgi:hypothetical protein